jgi:hypothetical protein
MPREIITIECTEARKEGQPDDPQQEAPDRET